MSQDWLDRLGGMVGGRVARREFSVVREAVGESALEKLLSVIRMKVLLSKDQWKLFKFIEMIKNQR